MAFPKPPEKLVSFQNGSVAAHDIGRQFAEHSRSVSGVIDFLRSIVRDDGVVRNGSVGREQLAPELPDKLAETALAQVEALLAQVRAEAAQVRAQAVEVRGAKADAQALAENARRAVEQALGKAREVAAEVGLRGEEVQLRLDEVEARAAELNTIWLEGTSQVGVLGPNMGGKHAAGPLGATATSMDYAQVAIYWAEFMDNNAVIPQQVLEISGQGGNAITGDHWSSRWWAHRAAELFGGQFAYFYMGPFPAPPTQTPTGGPIPAGALYYNTSNGTMYVWNGTSWQPMDTPAKAATASLFYTATAAQTIFPTGTADMFGHSHILNPDGSEGLEVYTNGVRLTPTLDYTVDPVTSEITLLAPAPLGSVVSVDVLTPPAQLTPGLVLSGKLLPWVFDGVKDTFPLLAPTTGQRTAASADQLFVTLDGVDQEPGIDFTIDGTGNNIVFMQPPATDAKCFCVMMFRTASGFLTFVSHDSTLTGDGTTLLPLGVVIATTTQQGAVHVPVGSSITLDATGALGILVATTGQVQTGADNVNPVTALKLRQTQGLDVSALTTAAKTIVPAINENAANTALKVNRAGDTMTGILTLSGAPVNPLDASTKAYSDLKVAKAGDTMTGFLTLNADPTTALEAATKQYVDTAVSTHVLYQGTWQVAANIPDLHVPPNAPLNGYSYTAVTAVAGTPELAPAGIPGIGGQSVNSGDVVQWNGGSNIWQLIAGSSLSIVQGDARYVNTSGDTMTGVLTLSADPAAPLQASTKQYTDAADALRVLKSGDTMTGPLIQAADPVAPLGSATKQYVDAVTTVVNTKVSKAGDTMTGLLVLSGPPVAPLNPATKTYTDAADALKVNKAGDTMTGDLVLPSAAPVTSLSATTKNYVDQAVASGSLYQGQWQVAANTPDLNVPPNAPLNGYTWAAETVDPNVAETAPAGIPGIGGQTIFNGDTIRWNNTLTVWEHLQGSSLSIAQADTLYVNTVGDVMTGYLTLNADPALALQAAPKQYVDTVAANYVARTGDTMTGQLALQNPPAALQDATNKQYVDQSIASASLYQGTWQVAANTPDLTPAVALPLNGYSWIAQTVDPNVSEPCPAGITGIAPGTLIDGGSTIRWSQVLLAYELIKGPTISLATATAQFVDVIGDTMTGGLTFNGQNIGVTFTGGSGIYSWTDKALTLRAGATPLNTQPRIIDNNGANARDILDTKGGQHIAGTDDFRSVGLRNGTAGVVPGTGNVTGAYQIRMGYNNQAGATYGHEIRTGHNGGTTNQNQIQFWLWQQTDTPSSAAPSGHVLDIVAGTGTWLPTDGHGYWLNGGGGLYKKVGSGIVIREHAGGTQPQIENNDGTNARDILDTVNGTALFVNKTGDTMSGGLTVSYSGGQVVVKNTSTANNPYAAGAVTVQTTRGTAAQFTGSAATTGNNDCTAQIWNNNGGWGWQSGFQMQTNSPPNGYFGGNISVGSLTNRSSREIKEDIRYVEPHDIAHAFDKLKLVRYRNRDRPWPVDENGERLPECPPQPEEWKRERIGVVVEDLKADKDLGKMVFGDGDQAGYDMGQMLALCMAKIKALELEVRALKGGSHAKR